MRDGRFLIQLPCLLRDKWVRYLMSRAESMSRAFELSAITNNFRNSAHHSASSDTRAVGGAPMAFPKSPSRTTTHVRCGMPYCDWGTPMSSFSEAELARCRREFRQHCIERHGLDPNDTERVCWFDLEGLRLTLLA